MSDQDIIVKNVRIIYPHIWRPYKEGDKLGAKFLLDPITNADGIKKIGDTIKAMCREKFKVEKLAAERMCMRNGDDLGKDVFAGYFVLSANQGGKVRVVAQDGRTIVEQEADDKIYSGCRVNAKVRLWAQDNQFGQRINAELIAVQFAGDDEEITGGAPTAAEAVDGFEPIEPAAADTADLF